MTSSEVLLTKFVWRFFYCCSENDHFSIKYNYTKSWQTYIEVGIGSTRSLEETNVGSWIPGASTLMVIVFHIFV